MKEEEEGRRKRRPKCKYKHTHTLVDYKSSMVATKKAEGSAKRPFDSAHHSGQVLKFTPTLNSKLGGRSVALQWVVSLNGQRNCSNFIVFVEKIIENAKNYYLLLKQNVL